MINKKVKIISIGAWLACLAIIIIIWQELPHHQNNKPQHNATTTPQTLTEQSLPTADIHKPATKNTVQTKTITVTKGDNLSAIVAKLGFNHKQLMQLLQAKPKSKRLSQLKLGDQLIFTYNNAYIQSIQLPLSIHKSLIWQRENDTYTMTTQKTLLPFNWNFQKVTIQTSLAKAMQDKHLPLKYLYAIKNIFSSQLDFRRNIHPGDSIDLMYKTYHFKNKNYPGAIALVKIHTKKNQYTAIAFSKNSKTQYYTPTGKNWGNRFLRSPVKYTYISSPFSLHRMHPILHIIRPHLGVDLAAPMGTPIHATADGTIKSIGYHKGYGNEIVIQHGWRYSTLYAHMRNFNRKLHRFSRVKRGQIIGYVGKTGLATGPHVHYEFRILGRHYNPMTVKLPQGLPILKKSKNDFQNSSAKLTEEFTKLQKQYVAQHKNLKERPTIAA